VNAAPYPTGKPILLVDFDGVIHSYTSGWKGAGTVSDPPTPGAFAFLLRAAQDFDVQIYSSRSKEPAGIEAMKAWFAVWDKILAQSVYYLIKDNVIKFPVEKPAAFLTLDDRCICFTGQWPDMADMLNFKPWNKR
jgi:hypothetical protein